jgi:hypothetical protein
MKHSKRRPALCLFPLGKGLSGVYGGFAGSGSLKAAWRGVVAEKLKVGLWFDDCGPAVNPYAKRAETIKGQVRQDLLL